MSVYRDDGTPIDPMSCTIEDHAILAAHRGRPVTNPPMRLRQPAIDPHEPARSLVDLYIDTYLKDAS